MAPGPPPTHRPVATSHIPQPRLVVGQPDGKKIPCWAERDGILAVLVADANDGHQLAGTHIPELYGRLAGGCQDRAVRAECGRSPAARDACADPAAGCYIPHPHGPACRPDSQRLAVRAEHEAARGGDGGTERLPGGRVP